MPPAGEGRAEGPRVVVVLPQRHARGKVAQRHTPSLSLMCKREMPRQETGGGRSARGKNGVQAERAVMVEGDGRPGKAGPLKPARDMNAT